MVVFPTAYFGNIAYFKELLKHSQVSIEAQENFMKQTYRNRCEIVTANGIHCLSVPVNKSNGSKTRIEAVQISDAKNWRKDHWKAIESAYAAAPFFEHYGPEVKELIYNKESNLLKFNQAINTRVLDWIDISIEFSFTDEYLDLKNKVDYRIELNQKTTHKTDSFTTYTQVFGEQGFVPNLSILDILFAEGPLTRLFVL
jgi:hypothetical protein